MIHKVDIHFNKSYLIKVILFADSKAHLYDFCFLKK